MQLPELYMKNMVLGSFRRWATYFFRYGYSREREIRLLEYSTYPGYEVVGTVQSVGRAAKKFVPGDRVVRLQL